MPTPTRLVSSMILVAFFVGLQDSDCFAQEDTTRLTTTGTTMGVVSYTVTAFGDSSLQSEFESVVFNELELVNQRMSTYIENSDVSQFNQSSSTDWIAVTRDTALVVEKSLEISRLSDGAFDITVQPLVALWNFSVSDSAPFEVPDDGQVARELAKVGYQNLESRLSPPSLRKTIPELQIDLSAIAKGYSVDMVHQRLQKMGLDNYLIEVGGEIRASGEKPDQMAWRVGIEKPIPGVRIPYRIIGLNHKSLASSGDYRNFYEFQGKRYSHTIDPRTGYPVEHNIAASSVIAMDCMTADALATALIVLGRDAGLKLAEKLGVQAIVMERVGDDLVVAMTRTFPKTAEDQASTEPSIFRMIGIASVFFLFAIVAMAIGVIFGRERIKGSCGGIAALDNPDVSPECSLCSRAAECDTLEKEIKQRHASAPDSADGAT